MGKSSLSGGTLHFNKLASYPSSILRGPEHQGGETRDRVTATQLKEKGKDGAKNLSQMRDQGKMFEKTKKGKKDGGRRTLAPILSEIGLGASSYRGFRLSSPFLVVKGRG